MWSLFWEVRLAWTHNQPDENGILRQQIWANLCSRPVFHFKQEDCNVRKYMIWFKTFIKEVERWISERICVSASWSDVNLLPSSWMLAAAAESFTFSEEVQKICTWSHILSLRLQPSTFHWSQQIFKWGLQWMLCKTKIKLDFGGKTRWQVFFYMTFCVCVAGIEVPFSCCAIKAANCSLKSQETCLITHRMETHFQSQEYFPTTDASSHTLLPVNHLKPTKKTPFFSWLSFRKHRRAEDKRSHRVKIIRGFKLAHTSDSGYNGPL